MLTNFIYYASASILSYQIIRAAFYWFHWFVKFMFDEGFHKFKSKIEKPRLFFHLNTIVFTIIVFIQLGNSAFQPNGSLYLQFLYLMAILFFGIMFHLTWCNIFEVTFIPSIKKSLNDLQLDFKSNISSEEARALFGGLVNKGFLTFDDVQNQKVMEKKFVDVFVYGILPDLPFFSLQMKNDQIAVLYNCFLERTDQFSRVKFSQIFTRKGNPINLDSLRSSKSRAQKNALRDKTKFYTDDQNIIEYLFKI